MLSDQVRPGRDAGGQHSHHDGGIVLLALIVMFPSLTLVLTLHLYICLIRRYSLLGESI